LSLRGLRADDPLAERISRDCPGVSLRFEPP
jgi:hypothetical protein